MRHIEVKTIGQQRGCSRIWFEGKKIEDAGFQAGSNFTVSFGENGFTVALSDEGDRVVSSKKKAGAILPVIDLCNQAVAKMFEGMKKVKAIISRSKIVVSIHPDELAMKRRLDLLGAKLKNGSALTCAAVSHGGGIMDYAVHQGLKDGGLKSFLGFAVEIEPKYLDCSLTNNPVWSDDSLAIEAPMEQVELDDIPECDLYVAGIPCTGASKAGRSKNGLAHAEGHKAAGNLFHAYLNIFRKTNPAVAILENVPEYQNTASMDVIRNTLTAWGYDLHEMVLNGNNFGALENRNRLVVIAVTRGMECDFSKLTPVRQKESSLSEILEDIPADSDVWKEFGYLKEKQARDIKAGKGFKMQILDGLATSCGVIGRGYAKIRGTEIKIQHPTNPDLMRQLTVTEHARVKAIPEFLVEGVSATTAHEIMGQSCIFPVFQAVGKFMASVLQDWLMSFKKVTALPERPAGHQYSLFDLPAAA